MATPPDLRAIRTDYMMAGLEERDLDPSPMKQLERWLHDAVAAGHPEPTAMSLATNGPDGPSSRIVLMKGLDERGLVFFTNYESAKGRDLAHDPRAAANLFWVLLERQVRVRGEVARVERAESEAYFASRPRGSQLGAWASDQSQVVQGRAALAARYAELERRFGDGPIPCPPHWGGYRLAPREVELWQGRPSRMHDRLRYTRQAGTTHAWRIERLAP